MLAEHNSYSVRQTVLAAFQRELQDVLPHREDNKNIINYLNTRIRELRDFDATNQQATDSIISKNH